MSAIYATLHYFTSLLIHLHKVDTLSYLLWCKDHYRQSEFLKATHPAFTCSKSTMETTEECVKAVKKVTIKTQPENNVNDYLPKDIYHLGPKDKN